MRMNHVVFGVAIVVVIILPCCLEAVPGNGKKLHPDFYKNSCPNAEKIIFDVMMKNKDKPGTIPGITRLLFHDCFITGCDASILLETSPSNQTEIAFPANGVSIRGLDVIAEAKAELEKQCPETVSCADLIAYAARDAAVISGNPRFSVSGGRRDSLVSRIEDAMALPAPSWTMEHIMTEFSKRHITIDGTVALLGAHSIGVSRCFNTVANKDKLDAVPGAEKVLDPATKEAVIAKCPNILEGNVPFNLVDEKGPWGVSYYNRTVIGIAVMPSDLGMMLNPKAKLVAQRYAANPKLWAEKFNEAMLSMGTWNVITGDQGQVRKSCGFVN